MACRGKVGSLHRTWTQRFAEECVPGLLGIRTRFWHLSLIEPLASNRIIVAVIAHGRVGILVVWDYVLLRKPAMQNVLSLVCWAGSISIFGFSADFIRSSSRETGWPLYTFWLDYLTPPPRISTTLC